MKALITIALIVAAITGIVWYADYAHDRAVNQQVEQLKLQNEELLNKLARTHLNKMLEFCAKNGGGLQCKQEALFDCQHLYGSRCNSN